MKSNDLNFYIPAMKFHQREDSGNALFLGVVKARDFFQRVPERFKIDYYSRKDGKEEGYQRLLSDKSVEKIKDFILSETNNPLLPTALLVNSRELLDFKKSSDRFGNLYIDSPLHIIDGQHRFEAWKSMMEDVTLRNKWGDFEFPIVILSGFKEIKEIEQFFVINSRQKRIKTDLAERNYLALAGNKETKGLVPESANWKLHAVKIVDYINEQLEDSIWNNNIILPADSNDLRKAKVISQSSFVSSLKPLFIGQHAIFKSNGKDRAPIEDWAEFLASYWDDVISKIYPNAVKHPKDYSLMKTVGVFSLHMLLGRVVNDVSQGRPITKNIQEVSFKKIRSLLLKAAGKRYKEEFWKVKINRITKEKGEYAGAYSSAVGHKKILTGLILGGDF